MSASPVPVHVIVHTHWDREWYLTQQATAQRLVLVVQRCVELLDSGALPQVLLDGQTVLLEDFLAEAEPALWAAVLRHLRAGRLQVGPWYVAADEFLCSGEALLRNLELGTADARAAGSHSFVGYLPDTFGHIAQMPQLLREFGITSAVVWRGVDLPVAEFDWRAPDGSIVGAVFLPEGYYQHALNQPEGDASTLALLTRLRERSASGVLLLPQGGDHLLPAQDLAARVQRLNTAQPSFVLQFADLAGTVHTMLERSEGRRLLREGELRENTQAFVLPDVLSTRRPLKLACQRLEDRLLGALEPLLACWVPVEQLPLQALQRSWRELLQQTAHDSICGCSADAVHREMATRFERLAQRISALSERALAAAGLVNPHRHAPASEGARAVFGDDSRCLLWNPLPQRLAAWHPIELLIEGDAATLELRDANTGLPLPTVSLGSTPGRELRSPLDDFPDPLVGRHHQLLVRAELVGLATLTITAHTLDSAPVHEPMTSRLANARLTLWLDDAGQLCLARGGRTLDNVLLVQHELDAGDSYTYSPPPQQRVTLAAPWQRVHAHRVGAMQELMLKTTIRVPAGLREDRLGASDRQIELPIQLRLRLLDDEDAVHAELQLESAAEDQRLRLVFAAGSVAETQVASASGQAWIDRRCSFEQVPQAILRSEMPVAVFPTWQALVAGPWWVAHEGLNEAAMLLPPSGPGASASGPRLAMTLLRSVGWLSRRDLVTRGVGAGPDLPTPDAQCKGQHAYQFRFGLADDAAHGRDSALAAARALNRPAQLLPGHGQPRRPPFDIGNAALQVSALRPVRIADGRVVRELRVWNPTPQWQALALRREQWQAVRADGTRRGNDEPRAEPCLVPPHAICTLREVPP